MWTTTNQGRDEKQRIFGYVGESGRGGGGYFFTWRPTLKETLASINADAVDPPRKLRLRRVEGAVRRMWLGERFRPYWATLIPTK